MQFSGIFVAALVAFFITISGSALADSASSNFENPPYTTGNIHGQDGWMKTGSFDAAVEANTYGIPSFGDQTLRISDSVTSGSFGDQTFAKPLADAVGESTATNGAFSAGTKQPHFEMQFDIASTQATEQPGMHTSVSPDRGDGSRMSYLRFEDSASGINIFFDDVTDAGPLGTGASFNETLIGTVSRAPHTIKLTMDTLDGPGNDVVKVFIDGNLVHMGTSWEDYYRYDPESVAEQSPRIVKTVLFRQSGTAHAGDAGKGFLIDNLSISSGATPATPSENTIVVHPADMATSSADVISTPTKWFFYNDETNVIDNSLGSFVTGPSTPPAGTGSAEISVSGTQRRNLSTYQFGGTKLGDISTLKYSTYNPSAGNGGSVNRSAYLNFNVDFTGTSSSWQRRIGFVPSQNGSVSQDSWNEWDVIQGGNAKWFYSGSTWPVTSTGPDAGLSGVSGSTLRTWNTLLADYPGIRVLPGDSWFGMRVGEPYADGYTENLDRFVLGTAAATTVWNFDPTPAPTNSTVHIFKYIDGAQATVENATGVNFPMFTSTYNAPFTLGPNGWTTGDIPYEASTSPMAIGASYSAQEKLDTSLVGTSCDGVHPYALVGYSTGDTMDAALQGATTTDIPAFTELAGDKYIIVRNTACPPLQTLKVHILKYLDGVMATIVPDNYQFPMTATWNASNIGAGTGIYVLGNSHGGAAQVYGADTSAMTAGADYTTSEITEGDSLVVSDSDSCEPGKYVLNGYRTSSVDFAAAAAGALSTTAPVFTALTADQYVIVDNSTCPTTGSISGMKYNDLNRNGVKDDGEPGLAGWTIRLRQGRTVVTTVTDADGKYQFTDLAPGTYRVREVHQKGWKRMSKNPKPIVLVGGAVVTDVNFGNAEKRRWEHEDTDRDDERDDNHGNYYTGHERNDYDHDSNDREHRFDLSKNTSRGRERRG